MATPSSTESSDLAYSLCRRKFILILFCWAIFGVVFAPNAWNFSHKIQGTLMGVDFSEPEQVRASLVKNFSTSLAFPTAVVWDSKGIPAAEATSLWQEILDQTKSSPGISEVFDAKNLLSSWPRDDWHAAFIEFSATSYGEAEELISPLRQQLRENVVLPSSRPVFVTGSPPLFLDLNLESTNALRKAELIALPITFLILIAVFGSIVAALLPVLVASLGVVITLGILSLLSGHWPITFFVPNLVTMIGLGVGIDYSLIYLARYRREKALHTSTLEALKTARATAGHTVLISSSLVAVGFLSLFVIPVQLFHSISLAGILVVGSVSLATLTFLPALIFILGPYLEYGCLFKKETLASRGIKTLYHEWMRRLVKHPLLFFIGGVIFLIFLGLPVRRLLVTAVQVNTLPAKAEARRGYESMATELGPGWLMPAIILEQHDPQAAVMNPQMMREEKELAIQIGLLENTAKVISLGTLATNRTQRQLQMGLLTGNEDTSQTLLLAVSKEDPQSPRSRKWMKEIEKILRQQEKRNTDGTRYQLGGVAATTAATDDLVIHSLPSVIAATLFTTFFLLLYFMRSILVPLKAIFLNFLCVLAAYGFQVLWFQEGWGNFAGHFIHADGLNTIVLVICFCSLFGLSMDYEIFILSAVREAWRQSQDVKAAIEDGVLKTSGIITSAALIMVSVFLCFAFGSILETQQIGMGLSFAILLDATLIRLVLTPAALALMGRAAWWFPFSSKKEK